MPTASAAPTSTLQRRATEVLTTHDNGPTAQVDRNLLVLPFSATAWDPFIVLSEDRFSTVGFDWHPHRGFQTVTLVIDGQLEHRDNAGGTSVLNPGDAQYMAAGRYALHYELAHEGRPVRTLQLWLNLPRELKLMDTRYVDMRATRAGLVTAPGLRAHVHAGRVGHVTGAPSAEFAKGFTLVDADLMAGGEELLVDIPSSHVALAYVVEGEAEIGGRKLLAGQAAWFAAERGGAGPVAATTRGRAHVVVYGSEPLREPVALGGPFVMSSAEEIEQAFADLRAGRFGAIPE
jgi:redox-sensitive bicupin YhaK (pirin superfamily)